MLYHMTTIVFIVLSICTLFCRRFGGKRDEIELNNSDSIPALNLSQVAYTQVPGGVTRCVLLHIYIWKYTATLLTHLCYIYSTHGERSCSDKVYLLPYIWKQIISQ